MLQGQMLVKDYNRMEVVEVKWGLRNQMNFEDMDDIEKRFVLGGLI